MTKCLEALANVGTSLLVALLLEVTTVIEIFTTIVGVTSDSQNVEDTIVDGRHRRFLLRDRGR